MEIQGYSNYLIYPDGRVFSKKSNRFLRPYLTGCKGKQYYTIRLINEKNKRMYKIHRLVACHYIPNPDNLPTVDHIDRNTYNNDVSNLRWADTYLQCENKGMLKTNKSGFKNISYDKIIKRWRFMDGKRKVRKSFKTKIEAICYKYIHNLRIRAGHFT